MSRNSYIDILKGIGITSIVIGHSCSLLFNSIPVGPFVYTYHLMIFMFIIGYLIDLSKFEKDKNYKYRYIGKQILKMLSLYFMYNLVFVLAHNVFVRYHMIDANYYTLKDIAKNIFLGIQFLTNEKFLGALWFIPMMLVAKTLFVLLYSKNVLNNRLANIISIGLITGIIGTLLIVKNAGYIYYIHISIMSISFICLGVLYKRYEDKINFFITTWSWMPIAVVIFIILKQYTTSIDLSANSIINPPIFYLLSLLGIYFCLALAKTINYFKGSRKLFEIIGKNSFHIMALHFMIIKFIDVSYAYIKDIKDINIISKYPYSFSNNLWLLYIILGVIIPIIIITPLKRIKERYIDTLKMY